MNTRTFAIDWRTGSVILGAALVLAIVIAEVVSRALFSDISFANRALYWNVPPLVLGAQDVVHYVPRQTIREVGIYNGQVEYDMHYKTNNLGLIDNIDYPENIPDGKSIRMAVVGDSFTAGNGGFSWVPALRDYLENQSSSVAVYNLGVLGSGIETFEKNIRYFDQQLSFTDLVFIVISDDFFRLWWRPLTREDGIRLCPDGETEEICSKRRPFGHLFDPDMSASELLQVSNSRMLSEEARFNQVSATLPVVVRSSRFLSMLYRFFNNLPLFAMAENRQQVGEILQHYLINRNLETLDRIASESRAARITLLQLPEREEVRSGAYRIPIGEKLTTSRIKYVSTIERCPWEVDWFHKYDTHPTEVGYRHILGCVSSILNRQVDENGGGLVNDK